MKKIVPTVLCTFLLLCLTGCAFVESAVEETIPITSQSSPDGDYTLQLFQVGSPTWSFGSVKARLVLQNADGDTVDAVDFSLNNDGGGVHAYNIEDITWHEDHVEILMNESDTIRQYTYRLYYEAAFR